MNQILSSLPKNLPIPQDDNLCCHLEGKAMPDISLLNSQGKRQKIFKNFFLNGRYVLYFYPMTGNPNKALPENWDKIAGARGCTPETLSFKKHQNKLKKLNAIAIGISTQLHTEIREMKIRLAIEHDVLSDADLKLARALSLPTFSIKNQVFINRLTLVVENKKIKKCFYPIFPPDKHIFEVLDWLEKTYEKKLMRKNL